ncbi:MAG: hypothetical protein PW786_03430 [Arachidicoccus sp.]|nr:hypothetical protein [Arachidicoccus sp.]
MNKNSDFKIFNPNGNKENLYTVPANYFESLSNIILSKIKLSLIRNNTAFSLPEHYFSDFPNKIISRIKQEGSETPILNSISKEMLYVVPQNYFNELTIKLSDKKAEIAETKIIPFVPKHRNWRMAIAAAVVSAIVLSAGLIWENNNTEPKIKTQYASVLQNDLSSLSNQEIENYLNYSESYVDDDSVNVEQTQNELKDISGSDVETYLNQTPSTY